MSASPPASAKPTTPPRSSASFRITPQPEGSSSADSNTNGSAVVAAPPIASIPTTATAQKRFHTAFMNIVSALTQYNVDREYAIAEARRILKEEEAAALEKAKEEKEAKERAEKEAKEKEERDAAAAAAAESSPATEEGVEGREASPNPVTPPPAPSTSSTGASASTSAAAAPAEKRTFNSLFASLGGGGGGTRGEQGGSTSSTPLPEGPGALPSATPPPPAIDPHAPTSYVKTATECIIKALKELFEGCLVPTDAPFSAPYAPWIARVLTELGGGRGRGSNDNNVSSSSSSAVQTGTYANVLGSILEDHNVALYAVCFCNSACIYSAQSHDGEAIGGGGLIDGDVIYRFIMAVARIHRRQRKIIHVCFSGIVNVCHVPKFSGPAPAPKESALAPQGGSSAANATDDNNTAAVHGDDDDAAMTPVVQPQLLLEYLAPQHCEARVVEAWCMAVTNLCLRFPTLIMRFCECGAVNWLERLLLLFGDDAKVLNRGLTLLALLTQHTVATE